ncbi:MAG: hypothetical protein RL748_3958 [Pseudomonadota bacterium]|jgi:probable rRNA maturation factor
MPEKNKLSLAVQYADPRLASTLPRPLLRRWVSAALLEPAELTLRFVDAAEGQSLNRDYRGKDYATNVLTFAYSADGDDMAMPAGLDQDGTDNEARADDEASQVPDLPDAELCRADIILCTDVLQQEAQEQGKTLLAHAAHLIVHGVLHAQGFDHEQDDEAAAMEREEVRILARLGFANPYAWE